MINQWKAHHSGCGYMWTWDDLKNSQMWTPPSTPATGLLDKTYLQNIVKLFICQIFWLEYIWLKVVGWPLNHCFQKYEATLSQTCAVEFGWTKSSDIFNWLLLKKICFIMHSTLKILLLNKWNINYQPCGTPNKWSTNY